MKLTYFPQTHSAEDRTPYTYVIRFSNYIYYGVKFAKGCRPEDLGKTYFSSSRKARRMIHDGESATFEIRRIFSDINEARNWETRVLTKILYWPHVLNKHKNDGYCKIDNSGAKNPMYGKFPGTMKGRHHTEESKVKISASVSGECNGFYGKHHSKETVQRIKDAQKGEKSFRFIGHYHTPHGTFASSREASLPTLTYKAIQKWCANPDKVISKKAIVQSPYLSESHLGKTFREIGFWFIP